MSVAAAATAFIFIQFIHTRNTSQQQTNALVLHAHNEINYI